MADETTRLRIPPSTRFGEKERYFDLEKAFEELPGESVERHGHIQKALYRYGNTTTAIFAFEAGGGLDSFSVEGEAIIHVIRGRLRVKTDGAAYTLTQNQILLLDPDVSQSMTAEEPTEMLMTLIRSEADHPSDRTPRAAK